MKLSKKLSNSISTGGGGVRFEAQVQASFVILMLTNGYTPCLPCWPIVEISFQNKKNGFDTDDLLVKVEDVDSKEQRKLIAQIKRSIDITSRSTLFGEVIKAAWHDFNNPMHFTKGKDVIVLITGPLSTADSKNVQWLLNRARHTRDAIDFFRDVNLANYSPAKSKEKLNAIHHHLKQANEGYEVLDQELYLFLKHFHILDYDLDYEFGIVLSLLQSHISQFQQKNTELVWSRVVDIVQTWNQDAGTLTRDSIPDNLQSVFKTKTVTTIPEEFNPIQEESKNDWIKHSHAANLVIIALIGAWQNKNQYDLKIVTQLLNINENEWFNTLQKIIGTNNSPITMKNNIWQLSNRVEILDQLRALIFDRHIELFKNTAINVLKESNPALDLPVDERFMAVMHGKHFSYSYQLRKGLAEGFALLSLSKTVFHNCSLETIENTPKLFVHNILASSNWKTWASLNDVLPLLAETAPYEFLHSIEKALYSDPCPFDEIFAQERGDINGQNYISGALWALEGLAWEEEYLIYACRILGELASRDPGGKWTNRPINSLVSILMPWHPQTHASFEKQKRAVEQMLTNFPAIGWKLLIQLLPNQNQTSHETYRPTWRNPIQSNWEPNITRKEYLERTIDYSSLAVNEAGHDYIRLSQLIDHLGNLSRNSFDSLLKKLSSQEILQLPETQRLILWNHLTKLITMHQRSTPANWAIPATQIEQIEIVATKLAPLKPFDRHQHLFTGRQIDHYTTFGNLAEQEDNLQQRRTAAVKEIFADGGFNEVVRFAGIVASVTEIGIALNDLNDSSIEANLLPSFLCSESKIHRALVHGYIWKCFQSRGWEWCDNINTNQWQSEQKGQFLAFLPFTAEVFYRVTLWFAENDKEYWTRCSPKIWPHDTTHVSTIVKKLIQYERLDVTIDYLAGLINMGLLHDSNLCLQALLKTIDSKVLNSNFDSYSIMEIIKYLQQISSCDQQALAKIEWYYLELFDKSSRIKPITLELSLANEPSFFCQIIQICYKSTKNDESHYEPAALTKASATYAFQLLWNWSTPPGIQQDSTFDDNHFSRWLHEVEEKCNESGHLTVAKSLIGKVLIHTPPDPTGLWIHKAVAKVLDKLNSETMLREFINGKYNSRGMHFVDPTGTPEKALSEHYQQQADQLEIAGYSRFAHNLRVLANEYESEAKRIISEYRNKTN
jgi:hypothetical protein